MLRLLICCCLLFLAGSAFSQLVLTITDARTPNPVAPYVYFLEDFTHKLTYEQVSRFPLDSFQRIKHQEFVQLDYRRGEIWMRFDVVNQSNTDLYLISSYRAHDKLVVFVQDSQGTQVYKKVDLSVLPDKQRIGTNPPIIPVGRNPKRIHIQLLAIGNAFNDYLCIGDISQAINYQKQTTRWQSLALGAFLIVFLYALIFFIRLRDSVLGWYTLLLFSILLFYVDFYRFLGSHTDYPIIRQYFSSSAFYLLCWSLFHIKFLNLRYYSKTLYWITVVFNSILWVDAPIKGAATLITGHYVSPLYELLSWLGIDWGEYFLTVLFLLLTSVVYVCSKNFRAVFLYAIAFSISLVGMIISFFALYGIDWLPYKPYNDLFVPATLIEVVMLGFILAEQQRKQQARTQQQLIDQLQENLRQKTRLLQIRDEIARDLHDEVGATLTSIAISTKLVQKKVNGQQPDVVPILQQIQTDSQETISAIRNTVWALNPDNDEPEKLIERLRTMAHQLLANQSITLTFESDVTPDTLPAFSMEQRRNIYLIMREALHNIVKHAQAHYVAVRIFQDKSGFYIRISDDGKGFDTVRQAEGNGLKNFQKRAVEGDFNVTVSSEVGQGTTVTLQIPLPQTTNIGDGVAI